MERLIKILLAEDDKNLALILKSYLTAKGCPTVVFHNGSEVLKSFERENFDFIILDVILPELDGYLVAEEIRRIDKNIPIMFLTAKSMRSEVSRGFEVGADDYVLKPFSMDELYERIRAVSRRTIFRSKNEHVFSLGTYTFDTIRHVLVRNGVEKKLTTRELDLLYLFCENMNRVVRRSVALQRVWRKENYFNARNMDVYITKIRRHLKDDPNVELQNIHGVGYKLVVKQP